MLGRTYKFTVVSIVMLLVIGLTLPACTCQQPTETEEPPTPSEQQEEGALSFKAAEYVNTEYGFSLKYPEEWIQKETEAPTTVFYAASERRVPALSISVQDHASFAEALTATLSAAGSDIKIVAERPSTLADGTPISEAEVKWKIQGLGADTFAVGVQKDDKWIVVAITTVSLLSKYDKGLFSEVAYTLQFE